MFLSFSEILRVFVVRGSEFFHGTNAGSVQVFDSFEMETVPMLLCPLSGKQYQEPTALHHSQPTVFKNADGSVSPK